MKFNNQVEAKDWLTTQPRRIVSLMASRSAARGLPIIFNIGDEISDREALAVFRGMHASLCASVQKEVDERFKLRLRRIAASSQKYSHFAYRACIAAIREAQDLGEVSKNVHSFYPGEDASTREPIRAASFDAQSMEDDFKGAVEIGLWDSTGTPEWATELWEKGKWILGNRGNSWNHWLSWYSSILEGTPVDWELQRRVAMIPDAIWDAGPERVAEEIEKIRALFELERRIEELEAERTAAEVHQNRTGIGGNSPPGPIEDEAEIVEQVTIVWATIGELKDEAKKEEPDKAIIARIIETLSLALKTVLAWCTKKADLAVDSVIRWAVPAAGGGYLALNPDKLEKVIEAAKTLLGHL